MRTEVRRHLEDLRWLAQADRHMAQVRDALARNPDDTELKQMLAALEQVAGYEREKLGVPAVRREWLAEG